MKQVILGSLNIDRVYEVEEFVNPGETIQAVSYNEFAGGKGLNQAIALARAGARLQFAGIIGKDGAMFIDTLEQENIDTSLIRISPNASGHAVIQVNSKGQNCIIVAAGSNGEIDKEYVDSILANFDQGDMMVLQNEVPLTAYTARCAAEKGMKVIYNPSPLNDRALEVNMNDLEMLFINEVEGEVLTGKNKPEEILSVIHDEYPGLKVVLTLGGNGSRFMDQSGRIKACNAVKCEVVDTTAAGDTFSGYFLSEYYSSMDVDRALKTASVAGALAVSRKGAAPSIPLREEVYNLI